MEDTELAALVAYHMGRLDEPTRTYAHELAKAVADRCRAEERERCALLCETLPDSRHFPEGYGPVLIACAERIRGA